MFGGFAIVIHNIFPTQIPCTTLDENPENNFKTTEEEIGTYDLVEILL